MLQIASGKLFFEPAGRKNHLRGVFFTNAVTGYQESIETVIGRILPSSSRSTFPCALIYEFIEHMEDGRAESGVILSSTVDPYLQDFSTVVSFSLNCICTPDIDLARRLTNGEHGLGTEVAPQKLVRKFFDKESWCEPDQIEFFVKFTEKLIGLPRTKFLGVMRAIRTYINGMHRIADDLELAYTLLVASVESLAQDFDGYKSSWDSYDERKRNTIDEALLNADLVTINRVKEALLKVEHVALGSRFKHFVTTHTLPAYFRHVSQYDDRQLARSDLAEVLGLAYQSRSKYVHQLKQLPSMVTMGFGYAETALDGRSTHLTLQGLARLMRSVIIEFVMKQPFLDREPYNYHLERTGVIQVPLAPEYWVGNAEGDITKFGRKKLEGFLQQLELVLLNIPNSFINDMRPVIAKIIEISPNIKKQFRLPYLALHFLFNLYAHESHSAPVPQSIQTMIERELGEPSSESLIAHALSYQFVDWPLEIHRQTLSNYFNRRASASGLRLPRTFEAALTLDLAERYRLAGDLDACIETLSLAVENYPGHVGLLDFEKNFEPNLTIVWRNVVASASNIKPDKNIPAL